MTMPPAPSAETPVETILSLRAALALSQTEAAEAKARAVGAEMMVEHLRLEIAKLRRERFGPRSERSRHLLDQLELQLEELEATATEDECAAAAAQAKPAETVVKSFSRKRPARGPLPALPREGLDLSVSTLADWVGATTATLAPLTELIRQHVMAGDRLRGDDTTVPVLAKLKTVTGRLWTS